LNKLTAKSLFIKISKNP